MSRHVQRVAGNVQIYIKVFQDWKSDRPSLLSLVATKIAKQTIWLEPIIAEPPYRTSSHMYLEFTTLDTLRHISEWAIGGHQ
jgi:hypothetical protein